MMGGKGMVLSASPHSGRPTSLDNLGKDQEKPCKGSDDSKALLGTFTNVHEKMGLLPTTSTASILGLFGQVSRLSSCLSRPLPPENL